MSKTDSISMPCGRSQSSLSTAIAMRRRQADETAASRTQSIKHLRAASPN